MEAPKEITQQVIEQFQKDVSQYSEVERLLKELEKQIKPLVEARKNLKTEKKTLETEICNTMRSYEIGTVNLPAINKGGKKVDIQGDPAKAIKYTRIEAVAPVTQAQVKESLIRFFAGTGSSSNFQKLSVEEKGNIAFDFIYNKKNRPKKVRETLRKVKYVDANVEKEVDIEVPLTQT